MSALGFNAALEKQPSEQLTIRANFYAVAGNLAISGYGLNACELLVYDESGGNATGNMVLGSLTIDANNYCVLATLKAGNDGQNYFARYRTTWTKTAQPDQIIEKDLKIEVKQKGF